MVRPRYSLEQRHAQILLQQRNTPRYCRLRAVQRLRGTRNAAAAMNRQEGVERIAVHVRSMLKTDDMRRNNRFG